MQRLRSLIEKLSSAGRNLWTGNRRIAIASLLCIGLSLAFFLQAAPSIAISVQDVPNPRQTKGTWVTDMVDMLSPADERKLNEMISALEAENGSEIAVVTVADTAASPTPKAFATELFNDWGIGKAGSDNGVLFLVSKGDRRTEIEVGYGLEDALSNAKTSQLIRTHVTPQFKQGNFDKGLLNGTEAIVTVLGGESLAPALPSASIWTSIGPFGYVWLLFLVLFVFNVCKSIVFFLFGIKKPRRQQNRSRYASNRRRYDSSRHHSHSHNHYHGGSHYSGGGSSGGGDFGGGSSGGGGGGGDW